MSDGMPAGRRISATAVIYALAVVLALVLAFTGTRSDEGIRVAGDQPFAFVLFVLVLLGVAFFHHHTMWVALGGVLVITAYTGLLCPGFHWSHDQLEHSGPGLLGHIKFEG